MTNRVTDQATQNALIEKFRLEGLLAEMTVDDRIVPVVQVGRILDEQNTSEFERWRSVFQPGPPLLNTAEITNFALPWVAATTKVAPTSIMIGGSGSLAVSGECGAKLPSGEVGVAAGDGIYRITLMCNDSGTLPIVGNVFLTDQAAFGDPVAIGTIRKTIGTFQTGIVGEARNVLWDRFVAIPASLIANAVVFVATAGTTSGGSIDIIVTKLIEELPPVVIFP